MINWIHLSLLFVFVTLVHSKHRPERQTSGGENFATVNTTYGPVKGRRFYIEGPQVLEIYLGVPYAKPPTGNNRWSKPVPPDAWTQTRDATQHGAKCIQRIIPQDPPLENVPFDEDCLFVDVYTPRLSNGSKTPTMMFIHGGGYYGGSGALYNFTNVALRGVTVVSVSYRLDIFGFFSTLDDVIPGNFGLLDQALALNWVKSNIAAFGGDPDSITVFGGSSGALSTSFFLISPLTQGKFHKAIMQSGVASCKWSYHSELDTAFDYPIRIARQFGQLMNCSLPAANFSHPLLDCLRKLPYDVIINQSVSLQEITYGGKTLFYPVIEKAFGFLPEAPSNLLDGLGPKYHIPTIYGYTAQDGGWKVSDPENDGVTLEEFKTELKKTIKFLYPPADHEPVFANALASYLPKDTQNVSKLDLRDRLVRAMSDLIYIGCAVYEARKMAAGNPQDIKTYVYEFAHRPSYSGYPDWMGVAHADEKGFVLGLPVGPDPFKYPVHNADDKMVADFVVTAWTNFAKFGHPTPPGAGLVMWPAVDLMSSDMKVMQIKKESAPKVFDRPEALEVFFNESIKAVNRNNNSASIPSYQITLTTFLLLFNVLIL